MFTQKFDRYVCHGDRITCAVDGLTIEAVAVNDDMSFHYTDEPDFPNTVTCGAPYTPKQIEAYNAGQWGFIGIVLTVVFEGIVIADECASLWGIEVNLNEGAGANDHLTEFANELLPDAIQEAKKNLRRLINKGEILAFS